ncbi:hypothetical protein DFAR_740007 [Desulfarculales bacterium]
MIKQGAPLAAAFSVVLPLPAPEPCLGACLASWLLQTKLGDEVLLICQGQAALEQAQKLAASPDLDGLGARVLH